jgi:crossover junction endodeoxyribonuclease RuvC
MKILAIDPGFERLGIAVIEKEKSTKEVVTHSECFHTNPKDRFEVRLSLLGERVKEIIKTYQPDVCAIETLFLSTNKKTGMHVAEARGVVLYEAVQGGLAIHEYTPLQVKVAVTGDGRADKKQVMQMVPKFVMLKEKSTSDDELDAIAIGLTCIAHEHL